MSLQFSLFIDELNFFTFFFSFFLGSKKQRIPTIIVLKALEADAMNGSASRALTGLWMNPLQDQWEITRTSCLRDMYFSSNLILSLARVK